jgi:hypothetical protein
MSTFDKHRKASNGFQRSVSNAGLDAVKQVGRTLERAGRRLADDHAVEEPRQIFVDVVLGIAKAHARLREEAAKAASRALKIVRQ